MPYEFTEWEQEPDPQASFSRSGSPPRKHAGIGFVDPPEPPKNIPWSALSRGFALMILLGFIVGVVLMTVVVRERFVERAGNTRMGSVIIWVLGLSGYILPVPSLIWGWVVWSKSRPRFNLPKWRYVAVFAGLVIASLVGLSALFVIVYLQFVEASYDFAMTSCARGIVASAFALLLSLIGKGPMRLPASLGSIGLAAFWFVGALLY